MEASYLFYGFRVTAESLCRAAVVWESVKPLRLIALRARRGTLEHSGLASLPAEIYLMVEQQLVRLAGKDYAKSSLTRPACTLECVAPNLSEDNTSAYFSALHDWMGRTGLHRRSSKYANQPYQHAATKCACDDWANHLAFQKTRFGAKQLKRVQKESFKECEYCRNARYVILQAICSGEAVAFFYAGGTHARTAYPATVSHETK